jgi:hypothetical protein
MHVPKLPKLMSCYNHKQIHMGNTLSDQVMMFPKNEMLKGIQ